MVVLALFLPAIFLFKFGVILVVSALLASKMGIVHEISYTII